MGTSEFLRQAGLSQDIMNKEETDTSSAPKESEACLSTPYASLPEGCPPSKHRLNSEELRQLTELNYQRILAENNLKHFLELCIARRGINSEAEIDISNGKITCH